MQEKCTKVVQFYINPQKKTPLPARDKGEFLSFEKLFRKSERNRHRESEADRLAVHLGR